MCPTSSLRRVLASIFLLSASIFGMAQTNETRPFEEQAVTVAIPGAELHGSLLLPTGVRRPPVALIIAGSGPTDRDGNNAGMKNNSLKMLAFALKDQGIASLRFDKFGVGASATVHIPEDSLRFEDFVAHVSAWIAFLSEQRLGPLYLVGHSEGSLLAILAAQQHPKQIRGLVSIAGSGLPIGDVLREQLQEHPPGLLVPALAHIAKLESGQRIDSIHPFLYALFRPSVQPYLISWMAYDPSKELQKLECPLLLVQGTHDLQVPTHHLDSLLSAAPAARSLRMDGMNHVLNTAPLDRALNFKSYSDPTLPLAQGLSEGIGQFILDTSSRR